MTVRGQDALPWEGALVGNSSRRHYGGRSPEERDAQRRARLLDAARALIGSVGYPATTIEKICSTANVSTRHFYLQYTSKEAVFIDLYESMMRTSYEAVLAAWQASEGKPFAERVPGAVMAYLAPTFGDLSLARIAFVEVMGVSPALERTRLEYREALISFIEAEAKQAVARGEIADRDFRFAALALIGAVNVIVYDWAIRSDRPPAADVEAKLVALAVDLIAG